MVGQVLAEHLAADTLKRFAGGSRWIKGRFAGGDGAACLLGGLSSAAGGRMHVWGFSLLAPVWPEPAVKVLQVIAGEIAEQFPDRVHVCREGCPATSWWNAPLCPVVFVDFNDHPDTTWEDVELVLEKAAASQT